LAEEFLEAVEKGEGEIEEETGFERAWRLKKAVEKYAKQLGYYEVVPYVVYPPSEALAKSKFREWRVWRCRYGRAGFELVYIGDGLYVCRFFFLNATPEILKELWEETGLRFAPSSYEFKRLREGEPFDVEVTVDCNLEFIKEMLAKLKEFEDKH